MFRILAAGLLAGAVIAPAAVTFHRDVVPILQQRCQGCHRPNDIAPMSFMTYAETRPWAKAMKEAVVSRKMPPWFADPEYAGHFTNDRSLTPKQIETLTAWVDAGAPEGNARDAPPPVQFSEGWSIGKPDMIVEYPHALDIPATGIVDQSNMLVRVNFPKDAWIGAAEVRPGNPRVVHHMKAWIRPPNSPWMKDAPEGELYKPTRAQFAAAAEEPETKGPRPVQDILAKFNPGVNAMEFTNGGAAKFVAAGSDIVFEIHYATTGKPEKDRSRVGIIFAKEPPKERYFTTMGVNTTNFVIPPGATNHEVRAESVLQAKTKLAWVQPHMHLRAKDYELRAHYPSGETQVLLKGKFDFNWQLGYEFAKPIVLPKGTRLESIAHYDNSANNKWNPNPNIEVTYGPQTTDEMSVSFMGFIIGVNDDPLALFPRGRVRQVVE
ncbi:MAG: hypothetical protein JWN34_1222 [Bryobacterales bacterium]|nr:hypothetical protein [Bryobacterales bacterium]